MIFLIIIIIRSSSSSSIHLAILSYFHEETVVFTPE